jgi:uncharacterized protein (DUF1015 family)
MAHNLAPRFHLSKTLGGGHDKAGPSRIRTPCYNQNLSMAHIIPFRGLRYDSKQVSAAQVLTQPYDKITPAMQDRYYAASPYNLVRIILGRREDKDNPEHNVYSRAASYFREWRQQGILRQDSDPSLYTYSQTFPGRCTTSELERRGFIALGRLEEYSTGVVFRHEQTLAKPKADRLDLLRATRAHFEQLFMLYQDSGDIDSLLFHNSGANSNAIIEVTDEYGVLHRVWQIADPAVVSAVRSKMRDKKLIIADGHHRYETTLNYRNQRRAASSAGGNASSADAPYEFAVMTFVNMSGPGLVILPTHRVVRGLASFSVDSFLNSSRAFFAIDELDPAIEPARATSTLREAGQAETALLAVTANRAFLLHRLKGSGSQMLAGLSPRQQSLDVVQLHKFLLEGVLALSEESIREQRNISYMRDAGDAFAQVRSGSANITFLMNPCSIDQMREVAFAGEVMPQKSTDFYPKLLSGLTIYALE